MIHRFYMNKSSIRCRIVCKKSKNWETGSRKPQSWKKCCGLPGAKISNGSVPVSFITTQYFSLNAKTIQSQCFGLWGGVVQCFRYFNVNFKSRSILKGRISWDSKEPWLKHLLVGFLYHVFLGKALGVPGACSPCSPLFSTLVGDHPWDWGWPSWVWWLTIYFVVKFNNLQEASIPNLGLLLKLNTKIGLHTHHHPQPGTLRKQYLSCYWPYFDQTLNIRPQEHLQQIPTVRVTLV